MQFTSTVGAFTDLLSSRHGMSLRHRDCERPRSASSSALDPGNRLVDDVLGRIQQGRDRIVLAQSRAARAESVE